MGKELTRWKRRKTTISEVEELDRNRDRVLVIHYSCESFYEISDGRTPRITSIAVRNLSTGQTVSFSIHKSAEQDGAFLEEIDSDYDRFERIMLEEFFSFLSTREGYRFVHWNMRDINYGFQAIEHRYAVLGGSPVKVDDNKKFDLARALVSVYGDAYVPHGEAGRMHSLVKLNSITVRDALTGREEADAFENKEFVRLHQSTLRKVDLIANIFERIVDGSLKTTASWWKVHGLHPVVFLEVLTEHWGWTLLVVLTTIGSVATLVGLF